MSEPTTKAGRDWARTPIYGWEQAVYRKRILDIEAEARKQERERLRKAVEDRWPEWQVGGPVNVPVTDVLALLSESEGR